MRHEAQLVDITAFGKAYRVELNGTYYAYQGQLALRALMPEDGSPFGTITVVIEGWTPSSPSEVLVKTWSENAWVRGLLERYPEMFSDTGKRVPSGHVQAEVWKLHPALIEQLWP